MTIQTAPEWTPLPPCGEAGIKSRGEEGIPLTGLLGFHWMPRVGILKHDVGSIPRSSASHPLRTHV